MAPPTILVVPGSFSRARFYDETLNHLQSLGITSTAHNLPSASREPPQAAATLAEDATYFNTEAGQLLDQGKDVIILGHSYGGMVATECMKGLQEKSAEGKGKGKVLGLIYLTALIPKKGESSQTLLGGASVDYIKMNGDFMYHDPAEDSAKINFSDLPLEEGVAWVKQFHTHSALSFATEATYEGWRDVPVAFIFCDKDKTLPPHLQQAWIDKVEAETGKKVDVYHLDTGHCPIASKPAETAQAIKQAVDGILAQQ